MKAGFDADHESRKLTFQIVIASNARSVYVRVRSVRSYLV